MFINVREICFFFFIRTKNHDIKCSISFYLNIHIHGWFNLIIKWIEWCLNILCFTCNTSAWVSNSRNDAVDRESSQKLFNLVYNFCKKNVFRLKLVHKLSRIHKAKIVFFKVKMKDWLIRSSFYNIATDSNKHINLIDSQRENRTFWTLCS